MRKEVTYYQFYPGYAVVKDEDGLFYKRDRENHKWNLDNMWFSRLIGSDFTVIEIDYDEEHEEISNRRRIDGYWSIDDDKLLNPEEIEETL